MSRGNIIYSEVEMSFICINCGITVPVSAVGTAHRNHCPHCLWSRHVDLNRGDRLSVCRGRMEPVSICESKGEWSLIHRCEKCGSLRSNRISGDDNTAEMIKIFKRIERGMPFACELKENYGDEVCR